MRPLRFRLSFLDDLEADACDSGDAFAEVPVLGAGFPGAAEGGIGILDPGIAGAVLEGGPDAPIVAEPVSDLSGPGSDLQG